MKKYIKIALSVIIFLLCSPVVNAQNVNKFTIDSFNADYYLTKDQNNVSNLKVTETITARFPDFNQNRGIERAIPEKYKNNNLNLKVESVTNESGNNITYTEKSLNDNKILRIGDANKYVQGKQVYVISYSLRDVITFFESNDEFYWDINGDMWQQTFGTVSATIHLPNDLASKINKDTKCFTGTFGSSESQCEVLKNQDNNQTRIIVRTNRSLNASENLSVVMAFTPSTFTKYKTDPRLVILAVAVGILLFATPVLLASLIMWRRWNAGGKDPKGKGVIIPQYSVPKQLNPVLADIILNEKLQTKTVSATVIDLCVKGYIKLYETKTNKLLSKTTEYEVELLKNTSGLSQEEQKVATMIFSSTVVGTKVNLNDLKNKLYKEVKTLTSSASNAVVEQQYFVSNPEAAKTKYNGWGILLLIIGIAPVFIFPPVILATLGLVIAGIIILIFGSVMPKRTQKGVDTKEYLLGVEDYMKLAEKDRIQFLQSPTTAEKIDVTDTKKMIKLYEKLLPYAILFGIEKDWAKQFANLYAAGQSPSWYSGNTAFNAVLFSNAISGFNSVAVNSFSSPTSSGSSGYSGGGGFSGGGGGGGGGSGW